MSLPSVVKEDSYVVLKLNHQQGTNPSENYVIVRSSWIVNNLVSYPELTDSEDDKNLIQSFLKNKVSKSPESWNKYPFVILNCYSKYITVTFSMLSVVLYYESCAIAQYQRAVNYLHQMKSGSGTPSTIKMKPKLQPSTKPDQSRELKKALREHQIECQLNEAIHSLPSAPNLQENMSGNKFVPSVIDTFSSYFM